MRLDSSPRTREHWQGLQQHAQKSLSHTKVGRLSEPGINDGGRSDKSMGSILIDITWPKLHRVSLRSLRDKVQRLLIHAASSALTWPANPVIGPTVCPSPSSSSFPPTLLAAAAAALIATNLACLRWIRRWVLIFKFIIARMNVVMAGRALAGAFCASLS